MQEKSFKEKYDEEQKIKINEIELEDIEEMVDMSKSYLEIFLRSKWKYILSAFIVLKPLIFAGVFLLIAVFSYFVEQDKEKRSGLPLLSLKYLLTWIGISILVRVGIIAFFFIAALLFPDIASVNITW